MEFLTEINGNEYLFTNSIKENDTIRKSFDKLSQKTFGLSFEDWYNDGYWTDAYIPYVLLNNNQVVSNVSVNIMNLDYLGTQKNYIQLGTVMTDIPYRNQGLSKYLMNVVLTEFSKKSDEVYLFANDSVLDFYPKFGFQKAEEHQYICNVNFEPTKKAQKLNMSNLKHINLLRKMAVNKNPYSKFQMIENDGLLMFYCSKFMRDNVYYTEEYSTIIIADITDDVVVCYDVFCENNDIPLQNILSSIIAKKGTKIQFGFTPLETNDYDLRLFKEEGTTLFMLNKKENLFTANDLMFPLLSHA